MKLSATFEAIASKHLAACDLPNRWSHQHELTGVKALRAVLGTDSKTQGRLLWTFFPQDAGAIHEENSFTFYDARAKGAARTGRSEWRLYYYGNFLAQAELGDLLILAKTRSRGLAGMLLPKNSDAYREAISLSTSE